MADPLNLQLVVSTLQNVVTSIATLTQTIANSTSAIFPQTQSTSSTATAGAATLPGNPVGFIEVTLPSGATAKVPYYNV